MTKRLNLLLSEETLREIEAFQVAFQVQAELRLSERLRFALLTFSVQAVLASPSPLEVVIEGGVIKNRAAVELEERLGRNREALFREMIAIRDQTITELRLELANLTENVLPPTHQEAEEIEQTSVLLAFWNSLVLKPGLLGFSIDLKMLGADISRILKENSRIIELGLNRPRRKR